MKNSGICKSLQLVRMKEGHAPKKVRAKCIYRENVGILVS